MPFFLGPLELILVLSVILGIPMGLAVAARKVLARSRRVGLPPSPHDKFRQLASDLDDAHARLHDMETKLAEAEKRAQFAEALLDKR